MKVLIVLLVAAFAARSPFASAISYQGQQVWRVYPNYKGSIEIMRKIGRKFQLDFWKEPTHIGQAIDFRVFPRQRKWLGEVLDNAGFWNREVWIPNIQKLIDEQKRPSRTVKEQKRATPLSILNFDYASYHQAEEIYEWMDLVVAEHGDFVKKHQFGITYQGRPLYVLEIKKPSSEPKPTIFVDALIHCREWISSAALLFIFKEMLKNPAYSHMMDEADWYYVPMINVDGYIETWSGDRLWRKTRSTGPSSVCTGVDGNRNWAANSWSFPGASSIPCSYTYYGPQPASESEVRHLSQFIMSLGVGNISAYVTTHSYSQLILYPFGWTEDLAPENDELNVTSKKMHDAIKDVHGMYYTYGPSSTTIYVSSGSTTDWTYDFPKIVHSYTYELRDTGRYGFLLPANQIIPNGEEYLAGLEAMKNDVLEKFKAGLRRN